MLKKKKGYCEKSAIPWLSGNDTKFIRLNKQAKTPLWKGYWGLLN